MLVVVENRNVHPFAADALDHKAIRRFDIFQIDRAKSGLQPANQIGQRHRVGLIHFDVKTIEASEFLEQDGLAFHHRFRGLRADVAQPQNRGAIGDHGHQIALGGVAARVERIVGNLDTGLGHARRVSTRQIAAGGHGFGGADFQLTGARKLVII